MSIIGTGVAAGVAGTANQAQQAGRSQSAQSAAASERAEHSDKLMLSQLRGAGATKDADEEMPDNQQAGYDNLYGQGEGESDADHAEDPQEPENVLHKIHQADAPTASPTGLAEPYGYATPQGLEAKAPLFRQIDVTG